MNFSFLKKTENSIDEGNLKMIALVCMFVDHFAVVILLSFLKAHNIHPQIGVFFPDAGIGINIAVFIYEILRSVGRIAFPLFAFMIAEGVSHTRSKLKYGLRLLILALVSEIPFNMALNHSIAYTGQQNVFWTLLLGNIAISVSAGLDILKERKEINPVNAYILEGIVFTVSCLEGFLVKVDYGILGVLTIIVIYLIMRGNMRKAGIYASLGCIAYLIIDICTNYSGNYYDYLIALGIVAAVDMIIATPLLGDRKIKALGAACMILCIGWYSEAFALMSVPLVMCYNGRRGKQNKIFFYLFYPVHLILLVLLCMMLKLW